MKMLNSVGTQNNLLLQTKFLNYNWMLTALGFDVSNSSEDIGYINFKIYINVFT